MATTDLASNVVSKSQDIVSFILRVMHLLMLLHLLLNLQLHLLHLGGELRVGWCSVRRSSPPTLDTGGGGLLHSRSPCRRYHAQIRRGANVSARPTIVAWGLAPPCTAAACACDFHWRPTEAAGAGPQFGACCGGAASMEAQLLLAGLPCSGRRRERVR
jgi:hypothetical protein